MSGDVRKFKLPAEPTRRQRMTFEKQAGVTWVEMSQIVSNPARAHEITEAIQAALIFMAAKQVIPDLTFDRVIDEDGWELEQPDGGDGDDPLPPPAQS